MKLLPDTIIKSWLAAKVETGSGEEEKEAGAPGRVQSGHDAEPCEESRARGRGTRCSSLEAKVTKGVGNQNIWII